MFVEKPDVSLRTKYHTAVTEQLLGLSLSSVHDCEDLTDPLTTAAHFTSDGKLGISLGPESHNVVQEFFRPLPFHPRRDGHGSNPLGCLDNLISRGELPGDRQAIVSRELVCAHELWLPWRRA